VRRKGTITKERIINASIKVFQEKGISKSSMSIIADEVGLQKSSIYYFFPSKNDLVFETLVEAKDKFLEFLDKKLNPEKPKQSLQDYFEAIIKFHKERQLKGGCIFGNSALEMSDKNDQVRQLLCETFLKWKEKIKKVVISGIKKGGFRSDLDPEEISWQIVLTVEGGIMIARTCRNIHYLENALKNLEEWIYL